MGPFEQRLYGEDEAGDEPVVVLAGGGVHWRVYF